MLSFSFESLSWELSVLARAVAYKNLSGAAQNIGISQPQLSRIVGKIESQMKAVILDRASRRKAAWTPLAHQLAQAYLKSARSLSGEIHKLLEGSEPRILHVGTLEGLIPLANRFGHYVLGQTGVTTLDLDVFDLNVLEERFFQGDLDLIFTAREPSRKKYTYSRGLGYQNLERVSTGGFTVMSSYEHAAQSHHARGQAKKAVPTSKVLISNSLGVRRQWIEEFGGQGTMPSDVRSSKRDSRKPTPGREIVEDQEVLLFGQDHLSPTFWDKILEFR